MIEWRINNRRREKIYEDSETRRERRELVAKNTERVRWEDGERGESESSLKMRGIMGSRVSNTKQIMSDGNNTLNGLVSSL